MTYLKRSTVYFFLFASVLLMFTQCTNSEVLESVDAEESSTVVTNSRSEGDEQQPPTMDDFGPITTINGKLNFESWNHFYAAEQHLNQLVEDRREAFHLENPDLTDEEIEASGFNEYLPLEEFEQEHLFDSGREQVSSMIEHWLELDDLESEISPYSLYFGDEVTYTLLDVNGNLYINSEPVNYKTYNEGQQEEANSLRADKCRFFNFEIPKTKTYDNGSKRILIFGDFRSMPFFFKYRSYVKSQKKRNGRWKRHKVNLRIDTGGSLRTNSCEDRSSYNKWKTKNTASISLINWIPTSLWTEAKKKEFSITGRNTSNTSSYFTLWHSW